MIYITDASAMLAFLRDEAGADVIETYLLEPGSHAIAHSINLCEVFYDFVRAESEAQAQQACRLAGHRCKRKKRPGCRLLARSWQAQSRSSARLAGQLPGV
jgi:hypothetical protein